MTRGGIQVLKIHPTK